MCDRSSALLKLGSTPGDKDESTFDSDDAARSACDKRRRGRWFVMRNGGGGRRLSSRHLRTAHRRAKRSRLAHVLPHLQRPGALAAQADRHVECEAVEAGLELQVSG